MVRRPRPPAGGQSITRRADASEDVRLEWLRLATQVAKLARRTIEEARDLLSRPFPTELILRFDTKREILSDYVGKLPDYSIDGDREKVAIKIAENVHDLFFLPAANVQLNAAEIRNSAFSERLALAPQGAFVEIGDRAEHYIAIMKDERAPHLVRRQVMGSLLEDLGDEIKRINREDLHVDLGMLLHRMVPLDSGEELRAGFPANSPLFDYAVRVTDVYVGHAVESLNTLMARPLDKAVAHYEAWVAISRELAHSPKERLELFRSDKSYLNRAAQMRLTK